MLTAQALPCRFILLTESACRTVQRLRQTADVPSAEANFSPVTWYSTEAAESAMWQSTSAAVRSVMKQTHVVTALSIPSDTAEHLLNMLHTRINRLNHRSNIRSIVCGRSILDVPVIFSFRAGLTEAGKCRCIQKRHIGRLF